AGAARSRCARSSAPAAAATRGSSWSTIATASPPAPRTCERSSRSFGMADTMQLVLAGADERDLSKLGEYRAVGGYATLEKARGMSREAVIEEISSATLRGRGRAR